MKIIEENTVVDNNGLREELIIEVDHKRLYVTQRWDGWIYNWWLGPVVKLLSTDTLTSLSLDSDVGGYSVIDLALRALDAERMLTAQCPMALMTQLVVVKQISNDLS